MRSATFLITLILPTVGYAEVSEPDEHPMEYVWELPDDEQVDLALDLLQRGTDSERRWIAELSGALLWSLDSDEDDEWAVKRMDRLRKWIAREQDDFVLSNVVHGIIDFEDVIVGSLFLELLHHSSPNVRHKAILYYRDWGEDPAAIPILERLWESETREWIRDDLMVALATLESSRFIDDFVARARSDDITSAARSMEALGYMDDPRALAGLIELAEDRTHPLRAEALREVSSWSESPAARDTLLAASRDDDDEIRETAVSTFSSFGDAPEIAGRLLEVARSDANADVRYAALNGLDSDDEGAGEEIDWEAYGYEIETVTISCGGTYSVDPESPVALVMQSDPGRTTTRCWSAPGVAADFVVPPRIEGDSLVGMGEHHEYQGEVWVWVVEGSASGCWAPRERLVEVPDDWPPPSIDRPSLHKELDLFTEDGRLAAIWGLAEHGSVEFFDRDKASGVEAVAVDLPPTPAAVLVLLDSYRGKDDPIDRLLLALLQQVPHELPLEPELRSRLDTLLPPEEDATPTPP
jgi:hypothetical protein